MPYGIAVLRFHNKRKQLLTVTSPARWLKVLASARKVVLSPLEVTWMCEWSGRLFYFVHGCSGKGLRKDLSGKILEPVLAWPRISVVSTSTSELLISMLEFTGEPMARNLESGITSHGWNLSIMIAMWSQVWMTVFIRSFSVTIICSYPMLYACSSEGARSK